MLLLHDMSLIDRNIIDYCKVSKNVKNIPKFTQALKQIKQVAGVLEQDYIPKQPTISIAHIENIQVAVGDMLRNKLASVSSGSIEEKQDENM